MSLEATQVFTPGTFPSYTYVTREDSPNLEISLRDALATIGQVISVSGPSKSGKTVLLERVVGNENLIPVSGASIRQADDIWELALIWMEAPFEVSSGSKCSHKVGAEVGASGGVTAFGLASAKGEGKGKVDYEQGSEERVVHRRGGVRQVVKDIADSDYVILIDDFHYMEKEVQVQAAKQIKEAIRLGVKICVAMVIHRGDDVIRANPELRGRVHSFDLKYWSDDDLRDIAELGFNELKLQLNEEAIKSFVKEAAGSPQLMQLICLNCCFYLEHRERHFLYRKYNLTHDDCVRIFKQTSASTDFRSLVDVLDCGPKLRGTERKIYDFTDGTHGDVYRSILKAIAVDPPCLSFDYEELFRRTRGVCVDDAPTGSSVVGSCRQMFKLAVEKFPNERAIDWNDEQELLDIPDPYLLFYLRWSDSLSLPN